MPEQKKVLPQRSKTKAPSPTSPVGSNAGPVSRNYSPKKPDWDYWKKFDLWTLGQAVCLICECDPAELESGAHPLSPRFSSRFFGDDQSKALRKVYELAATAIEAGKLNTAGPSDHSKDDLCKKIEPHYFVAWAKSKGLFIPEHLEKFKDTFTADEIKPISSLTLSEKFDIPPQAQIDYVNDGKLDPYEQTEPTPVYPSMTLNAPHPYPKEGLPVTVTHEPGYRLLNDFERARLKPDELDRIYYRERQVLRLRGEQAHHEVIDDKQEQGLDRVAEEAQNQEPDSIKQDSDAPAELSSEAKNDDILKSATLTVDSDGQINLQTIKGKPKQRFTANSLRFKDNTTLECKTLLGILREGKFNLGLSRVRKTGQRPKEYENKYRLIRRLNDKLIRFFANNVKGFCEIKGYSVFNIKDTIVTPKFNTDIMSKNNPFLGKTMEELIISAKKQDDKPTPDDGEISLIWAAMREHGFNEDEIEGHFPNTAIRLTMHEDREGRISAKGHKVEDQKYEEPKDDDFFEQHR